MTVREYVDALTKLASEQVGWDAEVSVFKFHDYDVYGVEMADGPVVKPHPDRVGEIAVELQ